MKIVVISLKSAIARREAMTRQLEATGLAFHFLDAIDGRDGHEGLFDACDNERFVIETGRHVTPGEIGCYASHLAVWRICCASGQPVVVLEDDVEIGEGFADAIGVCERLIDGCGFIRLQTERRARKSLVLRTENGFSLYRYTKVPHSTAGYVIGPDVAAVFCERSAVLAAPVDVFLKKFWEHGQTMYGLVPYPVDESARSRETSIGGRHGAKKTLAQRVRRVLTRAGWFLRRLGASHRQRRHWTGGSR